MSKIAISQKKRNKVIDLYLSGWNNSQNSIEAKVSRPKVIEIIRDYEHSLTLNNTKTKSQPVATQQSVNQTINNPELAREIVYIPVYVNIKQNEPIKEITEKSLMDKTLDHIEKMQEIEFEAKMSEYALKKMDE